MDETYSTPLPSSVIVTGKVDFKQFYDCRKAKEILPKHYCDSGSNWLNQMKIIGVALGDEDARLKFGGNDFGIDINGTQERIAGEVIALLDELKEEDIVTAYSLIMTDNNQMFTILD